MFFDLSHLGLLKISGMDAPNLLQGQLTCDVATMNENSGYLAAQCNAKGRVISLFYLFLSQENYYLVLPRTMVTTALTALKKYAVFYKTTLTDVTATVAIMGQQTESPLAHQDLIAMPLPTDTLRHIIFAPQSVMTDLLNNQQITSANAWKQLDVQAGIPAIYPETSAQLLPHDLNLPALNAVSFAKGCYTGQEIIARMHYRGNPKNHLFRARIKTSVTPPTIGATIYAASGEVCGTLIEVAHEQEHQYSVLLVADKANAKNNNLYLDQLNKDFFCF